MGPYSSQIKLENKNLTIKKSWQIGDKFLYSSRKFNTEIWIADSTGLDLVIAKPIIIKTDQRSLFCNYLA